VFFRKPLRFAALSFCCSGSFARLNLVIRTSTAIVFDYMLHKAIIVPATAGVNEIKYLALDLPTLNETHTATVRNPDTAPQY
jgi:hypothetical protein